MKEEVSITIKVDSFETTIKGSKDQTILDAALENDVDAPYSCQGGACATCIGRLVSGNAAMQQNHILTDEEISASKKVSEELNTELSSLVSKISTIENFITRLIDFLEGIV